MIQSDTPAQPGSRLERLMRFLEQDPVNLPLLADAASEAIDCREFDLAVELLDRHAVVAPLPAALVGLQGIVAIAQQRFDDAIAIFTRLRAEGHDDVEIRFNLAWAEAMMGRFAEALDLLDDEAVAASPRGPALKIQMMHHLDLYEDALACGQGLAERYPDDQMLMGALATLALDAEEPNLARLYAERAGDNAEGLAALGVLTLGDNDTRASLALFDQAIRLQPRNPRAWVGKGLGLLASGDPVAGAEAIDRGALLFDDHIGSWIASGWAHFVNGAYDKARQSFDRAMAIDPNFSETHGGIAVLDIVAGKIDSARHHADVALRLDRNSFGGALAKSLLLSQAGDMEAAQRIRDIAMSTPIGRDGRTILQALIGLGSGTRK